MPDEKLAIQVSYNIKDETTYNREVPPLVKYAKAHEDWKCLLITYDEEGTEEGIPVVPVWKWLMETSRGVTETLGKSMLTADR